MFAIAMPYARYRCWGPVLALFAILAVPAVRAQPVLTLDRALRIAEDRSQQIVAQDSAVAAARDLAVAAGQLPDPTLKLGVINVPVNGPDAWSLTRDFMTMGTVGVMQEFTRDGKRKARAARYEREADTALAARAAALSELRRDTAMAWLDRHYQEQLRDMLAAQRDEARLQIEAADAAYRGGRGSQADVFAARATVAQIDDALRQAAQKIRAATTRLARWVGDEASLTLGAAPDPAFVRLDLERLDTELANLPQIEVLQRQEQVARAEAEVARSNQSADWSVELTYSQRGSAYSNMVSLNVSIPLQFDQANRQNRELAARLATADQLRAQREDVARERAAEVRTWLQQWRSDRERLAFFDGTLLPLSGERTRAALAAYRGGDGTLGAVLEARRMEIDSRLERIRLEMEIAGMWARLEFLIPARTIAMEK